MKMEIVRLEAGDDALVMRVAEDVFESWKLRDSGGREGSQPCEP
ncbi:hypothetical protein Mesop_1024 [Mesorhizobium opportunistum WSM2075]|uniref:GCN5-related N-acetyltransferase n=1 Tax=Mesorhizobium opportunistum (strain LMG 24607 / HAMBI 3007 / WSM2075) TaxID=536019 RepID=F7YC40_MESOW|nr:hypothetical protein Mesop_1024 [Mesorhizobium opportunistum WSM2075]